MENGILKAAFKDGRLDYVELNGVKVMEGAGERPFVQIGDSETEVKFLSHEDGLSMIETYRLEENRLIVRETFFAEEKGKYDAKLKFNVNLEGLGSPVTAHALQLNADLFYTVDESGDVTGEVRSVKNMPFDFREDKLVVEALDSRHPQIRQNGGINNPYILNEGDEQVWLYDPHSQVELSVKTDWEKLRFGVKEDSDRIALTFGELIRLNAGSSTVRTTIFAFSIKK